MKKQMTKLAFNLPYEDMRELKKIAGEMGISVSELIRMSIEGFLKTRKGVKNG